jgi:hypothetical protein
MADENCIMAREKRSLRDRTMKGRTHFLSYRFAGIILRHPCGIMLAAALAGILSLLVTATHLTF